MALTGAGFEVTLAVDGEDGLSQFHRQAFDSVICDILMPRKDGIEVLRALRALSTRCRSS